MSQRSQVVEASHIDEGLGIVAGVMGSLPLDIRACRPFLAGSSDLCSYSLRREGVKIRLVGLLHSLDRDYIEFLGYFSHREPFEEEVLDLESSVVEDIHVPFELFESS